MIITALPCRLPRRLPANTSLTAHTIPQAQTRVELEGWVDVKELDGRTFRWCKRRYLVLTHKPGCNWQCTAVSLYTDKAR